MSTIIHYRRKVGNTAPPFRYVPSYSDGSLPDFPSGSTVMLVLSKRGGGTPKRVEGVGIITAGSFSYTPTPSDVDMEGDYNAEWVVTYPGVGQIPATTETWPGEGFLMCTLSQSL